MTRDERITAGQIKGNTVTNAVALYTARLGVQGEPTPCLRECALEILELHKFLEGMDILAHVLPEEEGTVETVMSKIKTFTSRDQLIRYLSSNKKLKEFSSEDKTKVKDFAKSFQKTLNEEV